MTNFVGSEMKNPAYWLYNSNELLPDMRHEVRSLFDKVTNETKNITPATDNTQI